MNNASFETGSGNGVDLPISTDDVQISPALSPFGESLSTKLSALETVVGTKASQSVVNDLSSSVSSLALAVASKAEQAALNSLSTAVNGKASQASVDALTTAVNGKLPLDGPANRVAFTAGGGLSATNVQAALLELDNELSFQFPENNVPVGTGTFFDIGGMPSHATEAVFHLTGLSGSAPAGIVTQLLNGSGNPISSGYLGTTTGFLSTSISSAWATGAQSNVTLITTSSTASSMSGFIRIFKAHAGYWGIFSYIADPSSRSQLTIAYAPATTVSGIRCTLSSGNFDAGTQRSVWRR